MEKMRCKLCGRILTNPESIKRGYGKTCYNVVQFKQDNTLEDDVNFLKFEVKFLKRQLAELKRYGTSVQKANTEAIERIKQETRKEQSPNQVNMVVVIKELKVLLQQNKEDILKKKLSDEELGIKTPEEIEELLNK